jgi:hypothetical protein
MRRILIAATTSLLALAIAAPAVAGNWAVSTLDEPPPTPVAGVATSLGFTILQHGVTPAPWVTATLVLSGPEAERLEVPLRADGDLGHFLAAVTFPQAGEWTWSITLVELGSDSTGTLRVLDDSVPAAMAERRMATLEARLDAALERVAVLEARLAALEDGDTATTR